MADNVLVTAGSGTTIATEERNIGGTNVQIQRVNEIGSAAVANGQVVPTTTAGTLVGAREARKRLILANHSDKDVYVGVATVTTGNGFKIPSGGGLTLHTVALVQHIIASGTATGGMHYFEEFD